MPHCQTRSYKILREPIGKHVIKLHLQSFSSSELTDAARTETLKTRRLTYSID
jgi:hypothetical protein